MRLTSSHTSLLALIVALIVIWMVGGTPAPNDGHWLTGGKHSQKSLIGARTERS